MSARPERRCRPKRLLLLATIALAVTGVVVGPAAADSTNAADKEQLLRPTLRGNCNDPRTEGTATGSSAVIKKSGNNTVSAQVSLKNAVPNLTYEVHLVQTPSGSNCLRVAGFVRTNGQGNGNEQVSAPLTPGDTGAFVFVIGDDLSGTDLQQTVNQVFGTK